MSRLILTWSEYFALIHALGNKIPMGRYKRIIGINRGGLIPAVILSHRFGLPLYPIPLLETKMFGQGKEVLVVDDLVDTGHTLSGCSGDIAVLYKKPWSTVQPTYWVKETEDWVVFPYETKDLNEVRDK